ncbi:E3 ubiquitin-protein ligase RBBP6-like [Calonectris borealis]|uniref:E3 ubiquitin-protein ligase RBBP6-like n=1 Tax=Calonectris borealis TaxID=1323832 RepID=UPI003F4B3281
MRASPVRSAGGRPGWEVSKSPYSASPYSTSSSTCSTSRSGSSRTLSYSRSFSPSHSRSYSRLLPYPRRGKGKRRNYCCRSRSHGYQRSRSRSPPYRRCHSRSRSPAFRGQCPTKQTIPQEEGGREYFNRYREVPPYDLKAYYGRSLDFRDPFEKARYRKWERNYREWHGKFYKGYAVGAQPHPPVNRENSSPGRFDPPGTRQENSPYARGRREDYPAWQSHQNHNIAGNYPEKPSERESHGIKDPTESKDKEVKNPLGDSQGNKHKKRRKRDEDEGFPNAELLAGARKPREPVPAEDVKMDSLFMVPSRDDATPVRDEPMEADSIFSNRCLKRRKKRRISQKQKLTRQSGK